MFNRDQQGDAVEASIPSSLDLQSTHISQACLTKSMISATTSSVEMPCLELSIRMTQSKNLLYFSGDDFKNPGTEIILRHVVVMLLCRALASSSCPAIPRSEREKQHWLIWLCHTWKLGTVGVFIHAPAGLCCSCALFMKWLPHWEWF